MDQRAWVEAAKDLLEMSADPNTLIASGPGSQLQVLLNAELDWRERADDVPPEEERRRLIMEGEREQLTAIALSIFRHSKYVMRGSESSPEAEVKLGYRMALQLRALVSGRTVEEVEAAAHGRDLE